MPGKELWETGAESEDKDLDEVEEEASGVDPEPEPDQAPEPVPAPARPVDEGQGRGGAYRLDEAGNRIRVSATASDGVRERNKVSNAGPFAGRRHDREQP